MINTHMKWRCSYDAGHIEMCARFFFLIYSIDSIGIELKSGYFFLKWIVCYAKDIGFREMTLQILNLVNERKTCQLWLALGCHHE